MLSYNETLLKLKEHKLPVKFSCVNVTQSLGLITSEDVYSKINVPLFDNAAMDGFAIRFSNNKDSIIFKKVSTILAGSSNTYELKYGECCEITTGARLPAYCDVVIKVEDVIIDNDNIIVKDHSVLSTKNIRLSGEDIKSEMLIVPKNTIITPAHLAIMVASGVKEINVFNQIRVAIISTGDEVMDISNNIDVSNDKIYNSNLYHLKAISKQLGLINIVTSVHAKDSKESIRNAFERCLSADPDIIITIGGVSMGVADLVPNVIKDLNGQIIFHGTKIRPGKPVLFGKIGNVFLHGCPGNPISTLICFNFFILPFIYHSYNIDYQTQQAILTKDFIKENKLKQFLKGHYSINKKGYLMVEILDGQESFKLLPLLKTNCFVILNESDSNKKRGDIVEIFICDKIN